MWCTNNRTVIFAIPYRPRDCPLIRKRPFPEACGTKSTINSSATSAWERFRVSAEPRQACSAANAEVEPICARKGHCCVRTWLSMSKFTRSNAPESPRSANGVAISRRPGAQLRGRSIRNGHCCGRIALVASFGSIYNYFQGLDNATAV